MENFIFLCSASKDRPEKNYIRKVSRSKHDRRDKKDVFDLRISEVYFYLRFEFLPFK